jgi:hypothetical protein
MHTPVALLIFNRPEKTQQLVAEIAKAKPQKLFVIADGPRPMHPEDVAACAAARAVIDHVEWECEVVKQYSEVNLGCGRRPATGISWVFAQVDRAIILEDDCVPHPSFFRFCDELLEKYRDDNRIMQISGSNFQFDRLHSPYSYYFTNLNPTWGWATWRRAWQHYDIAANIWPAFRKTSCVQDIVKNTRAASYWESMFDLAYERRGEIDFWDYQWTLACWAQNGLSIIPSVNLVSNIGFGKDATHTFSSERDKRAYLPSRAISFPLEHPPFVIPNQEADRICIEEAVLPLFSENVNSRSWFSRKWSDIVSDRPSLRDPRSFLKRLGAPFK